MKVDDPRKLTPGTKLHWHDGSTCTVSHRTWGAVVVEWDDGSRKLHPFDDPIWDHFKVYEEGGENRVAKKAKPKTPDLPAMEGPGVAQPRIAEIDALADAYIKERDKRMKLTPKEIAAKQNLIEALHAHREEIGVNDAGVLQYRYDTIVITLMPGKEKLKVRDWEEEPSIEEDV